MTAKTKKPADVERQNKAERDRLLHSIFTRTAEAFDAILRDTPPAKLKASLLNAICTFMRINDISNATLPDVDGAAKESQELADLVRSLDADSEALAKSEAAVLEAGEQIKSVKNTGGPAMREMNISDPFKKA